MKDGVFFIQIYSNTTVNLTKCKIVTVRGVWPTFLCALLNVTPPITIYKL